MPPFLLLDFWAGATRGGFDLAFHFIEVSQLSMHNVFVLATYIFANFTTTHCICLF